MVSILIWIVILRYFCFIVFSFFTWFYSRFSSFYWLRYRTIRMFGIICCLGSDLTFRNRFCRCDCDVTCIICCTCSDNVYFSKFLRLLKYYKISIYINCYHKFLFIPLPFIPITRPFFALKLNYHHNTIYIYPIYLHHTILQCNRMLLSASLF